MVRRQPKYHVMDSAYDAKENRGHSLSLGHVPIIDTNPRRLAERTQEKIREAKARHCIGDTDPETRHDAERSSVERMNGRLKDKFGARHLRVRGNGKAFCYCFAEFGIARATLLPARLRSRWRMARTRSETRFRCYRRIGTGASSWPRWAACGACGRASTAACQCGADSVRHA